VFEGTRQFGISGRTTVVPDSLGASRQASRAAAAAVDPGFTVAQVRLMHWRLQIDPRVRHRLPAGDTVSALRAGSWR
jgi:hypothetical protein